MLHGGLKSALRDGNGTSSLPLRYGGRTSVRLAVLENRRPSGQPGSSLNAVGIVVATMRPSRITATTANADP